LPQRREKIEITAVKPVTIRPEMSVKVIEHEQKGLIPNYRLLSDEPPVSIQVAVLYNHSKALLAQRKIRRKLNLPVEIIKKWDYYMVIVPGFYTREDTYQYYPELAGLGFPGIKLIEKN